MALAPPLALKLAAGVLVALAVAHADHGRPPHGRTSVAVSRAAGNRWVVARSSTVRLPFGSSVEHTCARGYSFRQHHWVSRGCQFKRDSPPLRSPPL